MLYLKQALLNTILQQNYKSFLDANDKTSLLLQVQVGQIFQKTPQNFDTFEVKGRFQC